MSFSFRHQNNMGCRESKLYKPENVVLLKKNAQKSPGRVIYGRKIVTHAYRTGRESDWQIFRVGNKNVGIRENP
ncbi:hypothetical protein AGMMS49940_24060 [Spirochaetia bacterium]|nr:hypothetical protein AGMMS49940_24060 [Spirochaetia bacterium]